MANRKHVALLKRGVAALNAPSCRRRLTSAGRTSVERTYPAFGGSAQEGDPCAGGGPPDYLEAKKSLGTPPHLPARHFTPAVDSTGQDA